MYFASVGDVHGSIGPMVDALQNWEKRFQKSLSFVVQVGDFEPHRSIEDVRTMAAPAKHKKLGDFHLFYNRKRVFPWPVYWIGGNHEPYRFFRPIY